MQELFQLIADLFEEDAQKVNLETVKDDLERWDSMGTIDLVTQLESTYKISFELMEVENLTSVKAIVESLQAKGVQL
jgi:acyl carrier protein